MIFKLTALRAFNSPVSRVVDARRHLVGERQQFGLRAGLHYGREQRRWRIDANGEAVSSTIYNFSWLSSPGTLLLITGTIVALVYSMNDGGGKYKMTFARGMAEVWHTVYNMRYAALTILSVLGLAYVMNLSGQTITVDGTRGLVYLDGRDV